MRRIILKASEFAGERSFVLSEKEAHHVRDVLRLNTGKQVFISDGKGKLWQGSLSEISGTAVRVLMNGEFEKTVPPGPVTLAVALVKKGFDDIVRKSVEMGISRIVPLLTDRCVKGLNAKNTRWERIAEEAEKQSGRTHSLEISEVCELGDYLFCEGNETRFVADLNASERLLSMSMKKKGPYEIIIGPEGGWSPEEIKTFNDLSGLELVSIGDHVLRTDTAAIAAGAVLCEISRSEN